MGTGSDRRRWIAEHGRAIACPHCGSANTERGAEFGPFHMSETYFCRDCHCPFSRIKWGDPPASPRPSAAPDDDCGTR